MRSKNSDYILCAFAALRHDATYCRLVSEKANIYSRLDFFTVLRGYIMIRENSG